MLIGRRRSNGPPASFGGSRGIRMAVSCIIARRLSLLRIEEARKRRERERQDAERRAEARQRFERVMHPPAPRPWDAGDDLVLVAAVTAALAAAERERSRVHWGRVARAVTAGCPPPRAGVRPRARAFPTGSRRRPDLDGRRARARVRGRAVDGGDRVALVGAGSGTRFASRRSRRRRRRRRRPTSSPRPRRGSPSPSRPSRRPRGRRRSSRGSSGGARGGAAGVRRRPPGGPGPRGDSASTPQARQAGVARGARDPRARLGRLLERPGVRRRGGKSGRERERAGERARWLEGATRARAARPFFARPFS